MVRSCYAGGHIFWRRFPRSQVVSAVKQISAPPSALSCEWVVKTQTHCRSICPENVICTYAVVKSLVLVYGGAELFLFYFAINSCLFVVYESSLPSKILVGNCSGAQVLCMRLHFLGSTSFLPRAKRKLVGPIR
ncbi:hypothetical protein Ancab_028531 [Ancistrocladus abbreviatus]